MPEKSKPPTAAEYFASCNDNERLALCELLTQPSGGWEDGPTDIVEAYDLNSSQIYVSLTHDTRCTPCKARNSECVVWEGESSCERCHRKCLVCNAHCPPSNKSGRVFDKESMAALRDSGVTGLSLGLRLPANLRQQLLKRSKILRFLDLIDKDFTARGISFATNFVKRKGSESSTSSLLGSTPTTSEATEVVDQVNGGHHQNEKADESVETVLRFSVPTNTAAGVEGYRQAQTTKVKIIAKAASKATFDIQFE